jgi:hypothetical protein
MLEGAARTLALKQKMYKVKIYAEWLKNNKDKKCINPFSTLKARSVATC